MDEKLASPRKFLILVVLHVLVLTFLVVVIIIDVLLFNFYYIATFNIAIPFLGVTYYIMLMENYDNYKKARDNKQYYKHSVTCSITIIED